MSAQRRDPGPDSQRASGADGGARPEGPVYLDNHATTACDPAVVAAMLPFFSERFANPASTSHAPGRDVARAVGRARAQVAAAVGGGPKEIVFTSGTTESVNLALTGLAAARPRARHLITTAVEHPAVLDTCAALAARGVETTILPVDAEGSLDPADVAAALRSDTLAVAVMAANNEVGTIQPVDAVADLCAKRGVPLLVDAAQAVGKIPFSAARPGVALVAWSAHKMYGPKGIGALYVARRPPLVLEPLLHGGGHERGLRSGTLNVPAIVGFGLACELAAERLEADATRLAALRDRLLQGLRRQACGVAVNGGLIHRLPHNLHVAFEGVEGARLLQAIGGDVAVSSGSACASARGEASHVLRAMGLSDSRAYASLRFGLGRTTTEADIDFAVARVAEAVRQLRG